MKACRFVHAGGSRKGNGDGSIGSRLTGKNVIIGLSEGSLGNAGGGECFTCIIVIKCGGALKHPPPSTRLDECRSVEATAARSVLTSTLDIGG